MKRIPLLLLAALALTACAPLTSLVTSTAGGLLPGAVATVQGDQATLAYDGTALVLTNPGPDALTGDPTVPGDPLSIVVDGTGLTWTGEAAKVCAPAPGRTDRWNCHPLLAPADAAHPLRLSVTGAPTRATFSGYRPSRGTVPVILLLQR